MRCFVASYNLNIESSINNEISKIAELIKEDDVKFDDNIFNDNMAVSFTLIY